MTSIQYNYAANIAANSLKANNTLMDQSMARLSTGLKIGSEGGDIGMISTYNTAKVDSATSRAGIQNVNMAISRMKLVEAQAYKMNDIYVEMASLALQATSLLITNSDRIGLEGSYQALGLELTRIVAETSFNGVTGIMGGGSLSVFTGGGSNIAILVDDFGLNTAHAAIVAQRNAAGHVIVGTANHAAATGGLDFGTRQTATATTPERGNSTLVHTGQDATAADNALVIHDRIVLAMGSALAKIGGQITALEHTAESLSSQAVVQEGSASKVGDTNYATETTALASAQIISQAATSILAQANARASTVLTLLK
jgi:flagellin